jgi:hypothetical protein
MHRSQRLDSCINKGFEQAIQSLGKNSSTKFEIMLMGVVYISRNIVKLSTPAEKAGQASQVGLTVVAHIS